MNEEHFHNGAIAAAKSRISPRTGFVHLYYGAVGASDTIPIYENICYAILLLEQRKMETVLEAKDLLARLLPFQASEGNFPVYLHEFPRCFDPVAGLKIAPLFLRALRDFSPVLGEALAHSLKAALQRLFSFYGARSLSPLWEHRFAVCKAVFESRPPPLADPIKQTAADWWEHWVTTQFLQTPICPFYHSKLQMCIGPFLSEGRQFGFEPAPELIDWACGKPQGDFAAQIQLAALAQLEVAPFGKEPFALLLSDKFVALLWKDQSLHSLVLEAPGANVVSAAQEGSFSLTIALPPSVELQRDDLFESAFYVDASPEVSVSIGGKKGTVFGSGDPIRIETPSFKIELRFEWSEGDFCGHILRANRRSQRLQGDAYDWKIGLRTLRRPESCQLRVVCAYTPA